MTNEAAYRGYLEKVHAALDKGDAADGERLAKAVTALVRAERDVAEYLREAASEDDDPDAIRAELQSRFARFIDAGADHGVPGVPAAGIGEGSEG
jgi:hypothetical protein